MKITKIPYILISKILSLQDVCENINIIFIQQQPTTNNTQKIYKIMLWPNTTYTSSGFLLTAISFPFPFFLFCSSTPCERIKSKKKTPWKENDKKIYFP